MNTDNYILGKDVIIDNIACGMCHRTEGRALVIFKYNEYDFHRVMDHIEFYDNYKSI